MVLVIHGEVGQIIVPPSDRQLLVLEKRKILLPGHYSRYFAWGYMDHSARIALVEGDKVSQLHLLVTMKRLAQIRNCFSFL